MGKVFPTDEILAEKQIEGQTEPVLVPENRYI
jgi:hypothetical protein